jgi:hypothetical protein
MKVATQRMSLNCCCQRSSFILAQMLTVVLLHRIRVVKEFARLLRRLYETGLAKNAVVVTYFTDASGPEAKDFLSYVVRSHDAFDREAAELRTTGKVT